MRRRWPALLLIAYLGVLIHLTLFRFPQPHPSVNLVPFRTIAHDIRKANWEFVVNTLGNVVAFLPAGVLGPLVFPGRVASAARAAGLALALSASVEVAQYFQGRRTSDVDDLILNTLGGLLGWGLLRFGRAQLRKRSGPRTRGAFDAGGRGTRGPDPP